MKNIEWKKLILCLAIPLLVGGLAALLSMNSFEVYKSVNKPALAPPSWLFGVAWSILYVLMGISSYMICISGSPESREALRIYAIQLVFNFIWPLVFFAARAFLPAFVLLCVLWVTVLIMINKFCSIRPAAAYLQIPYLLWLTFAGYLNIMVYLLNR